MEALGPYVLEKGIIKKILMGKINRSFLQVIFLSNFLS